MGLVADMWLWTQDMSLICAPQLAKPDSVSACCSLTLILEGAVQSNQSMAHPLRHCASRQTVQVLSSPQFCWPACQANNKQHTKAHVTSKASSTVHVHIMQAALKIYRLMLTTCKTHFFTPSDSQMQSAGCTHWLLPQIS